MILNHFKTIITMKHLLLLTLIPVLFLSCNKERPFKTEDAGPQASARAVGQIPSDIGLHDIVLHPEDHSWKELDSYYRNEVLIKHHNEDYFENLKNAAFWHLIEQFKMLEQADPETIAFYVNQQLQAKRINNIDIFLMSLEKLKGVWSNEKIAHAAMSRYQKNIDYINANFQYPTKELERTGYDLNKLTKYASGRK